MLSLLVYSNVQAQDKKLFASGKLKPIVQVFGTASYDFKNQRYAYGFGRAHIGFQYRFNENWSAKIILDRGRPTTVADVTVSDIDGNILNIRDESAEGSYYTMFLKFASLQWKVNERLKLEGGALLQNHYITQERFWGLRYVAQTFQDLYWKIPSSDLGFIARYRVNTVFGFDAALTNGEGPRKNQDPAGKVKLAAGLDINPNKKIQTRLYYHRRQAQSNELSTEQMASVFAGIQAGNKLRLGTEFNFMNNLNYQNSTDSYGFSVFGGYFLTQKTQLFARFDRLQYDAPASESLNDGSTIIAGISHAPLKGIQLSLNYQGWQGDDSANRDYLLLSMEYKF